MASKYLDLQKKLITALISKNTPNGNLPLTHEKAYNLLNRSFGAFPAYVNAVLDTASLDVSPARYHLELTDWQELVMEKDKRRRIYHESAIAAISQIKRYCKQYGVDDVINVDIEDRYAVADFCCEYVNDVFYLAAGSRYNMEELTKKYVSDGQKYSVDIDPSI